MAHGSIRRVLTCGCGKKPKVQSDSGDKNPEAHEVNQTEQINEDSYINLSEVSAPRPVPNSCQEDAVSDSLDGNLAKTHSKTQLSNN
jgi:hypothetical protein